MRGWARLRSSMLEWREEELVHRLVDLFPPSFLLFGSLLLEGKEAPPPLGAVIDGWVMNGYEREMSHTAVS